jgi:hypothetical protein
MNLNYIQFLSKFDCSRKDIPELKKFEIKYDCEGIEEWNKFLHRNLFRFEIYFELKVWEFKVYFYLGN